jgi:hypothetical protein
MYLGQVTLQKATESRVVNHVDHVIERVVDYELAISLGDEEDVSQHRGAFNLHINSTNRPSEQPHPSSLPFALYLSTI